MNQYLKEVSDCFADINGMWLQECQDYVATTGEVISTHELSAADLRFLFALATMLLNPYDGKYLFMLGLIKTTGAHPMCGSNEYTEEIVKAPLFRIALDLASRAGIREGLVTAPQFFVDPKEEILTVHTAAQRLRIAPSEVKKLLTRKKLRGKKIGSTWIIDAKVVESFRKKRE